MASTYSNLKFQLMSTGENSGTWGNVTNVNIGTAIEEAIAGTADVAFSNANVTLTLTDTNATQTARNMRLNLTGTATTGYNLIVPAIEKAYIVNNGTDGTITVKNSTGTGIAVPAGRTMWVFNNGTNVVDVTTALTSLLVTGNTTLGDASGDSVTFNAATASIPNGLTMTNGSLGLASAPAAWGGVTAGAVQVRAAALSGNSASPSFGYLTCNAYFDGTDWRRIAAGYATRLNLNSTGGLDIETSATSTANSVITWVPTATFDVSGHLLVGQTSGSLNIIYKAVAQGTNILKVYGTDDGVTFRAGATTSYNGAQTVMFVPANSTTSRSINAAGSINASGADYAEYMTKADDCGVIAKGDICGVNADGLLTDKFSDAHSFVVKSTDPAYVGGDVWGCVGPEPETPADGASEAEVAAYEAAHAEWAADLEAARAKVDRIAFAGQVPVNVTGATPGQYINAAEGPGGSIIGVPSATPGALTVGKVWKLLPDGRAWVAVRV